MCQSDWHAHGLVQYTSCIIEKLNWIRRAYSGAHGRDDVDGLVKDHEAVGLTYGV